MTAVKDEQKYIQKLEHKYNCIPSLSWIKLTMLKYIIVTKNIIINL